MDKLIPVVVIKELSETEKTMKALQNHGSNCAEITFRTACAKEAIAEITKALPDMLVGAGTVLTPEQVDEAIEAGAKNGIFPVDDITRDYCNGRYQGTPVEYTADEDAEYDEEYTIDLSKIRPTVAFPHLPENTHPARELNDIKIDQVVIGSCTNGRISDLRAAAEILKGKKVKKGVRTIVIPATQAIYLQAIEEGLVKTFIEAGAVVSTPTCGPCLGGHMGILAEGEKAVATTNRNFVGRMGHVDSEIYLASPEVAAASAVTGRITDPKEVM